MDGINFHIDNENNTIFNCQYQDKNHSRLTEGDSCRFCGSTDMVIINYKEKDDTRKIVDKSEEIIVHYCGCVKLDRKYMNEYAKQHSPFKNKPKQKNKLWDNFDKLSENVDKEFPQAKKPMNTKEMIDYLLTEKQITIEQHGAIQLCLAGELLTPQPNNND